MFIRRYTEVVVKRIIRHRKFPVLVFFILLIAVGIAVFFWARQSSTKTANNPEASEDIQESTSAVKIETAYFTAILPSGYKVTSNIESASSQDLIEITAVNQNTNNHQLTIRIGQLPKDGFAGVPSYANRVNNPAVYTRTEFAGMPVGAPTFYSNTGGNYEITSFWEHAGLYASVTATGPSQQSSDVNQALVTTFSNWRWR